MNIWPRHNQVKQRSIKLCPEDIAWRVKIATKECAKIDAIYRAESRRVFATLIRLLGDFDLAEEALQESFAAAIDRWPREGLPANPKAWLVSAGRFKAIDAMRRRARHDASLAELAERINSETGDDRQFNDSGIADDRLRLIFTCCHPALAIEARVPLTLREVCGLTTEQIAHAVLAPRRRSRSASSAPSRRSRTRAFRMKCLRRPIFPSGSTRC